MSRSILSSGFILCVLMLMWIASFTGCVSSEVKPDSKTVTTSSPAKPDQAAADESSRALTPPSSVTGQEFDPTQPVHLGQVRLDLAAVLQGLFYRLQGHEGNTPGNLTFDPQVKGLNQNMEVPLSGFALKQISIRLDETVDGDPLHRRTQAIFKLADSLDRQLFVMVAADYLIGDNVVYIRQAAAEPYFPEFSDIRLLILPANRLPSLRFLKALSFEELLSLAAENALGNGELKAVKPGTPVAFKLMAFNMVRTKPGTILNIYTSKNAKRRSAQVKESVSVNKQGWTVAMVDGKFELNSEPRFWFYVAMTDENKSDKTKYLSRFSSGMGQ